MKLSSASHLNYAGIDPGFTGGIAHINHDASVVEVWDMPITTADKDRRREFDLPGLWHRLAYLRSYPSMYVGLEWPTTRPGEGAERSERFGRGKGYLEAFLFTLGIHYDRLSPAGWKGRLGLPGKGQDPRSEQGAKLFDLYYPEHTGLIRGPRGGVKNGRLDALLMAHFLRTRDIGGARSVVQTFGKNSVQALAYCLGAGKKRRRN